ncbi:hypothetical protein GCM10007298_02360 [Williamsia phyllosphaerae]|uniref:Uncharacterized protein n=1 Tax=Williamsia phyllosphaerae TaxID=885042 RepID=A0ABQ1U7J7_9NOCA|nr:hypothetical protein GCM10007298_02360 [Williamsia phyllosphaerae]
MAPGPGSLRASLRSILTSPTLIAGAGARLAQGGRLVSTHAGAREIAGLRVRPDVADRHT